MTKLISDEYLEDLRFWADEFGTKSGTAREAAAAILAISVPDLLDEIDRVRKARVSSYNTNRDAVGQSHQMYKTLREHWLNMEMGISDDTE